MKKLSVIINIILILIILVVGVVPCCEEKG